MDATSEYAFTEVGLFPRPDADPEMFYVLGLLCGKAISMNICLPIPLSEAFMKFVSDEPLTLADVDPTLAKGLTDKEGVVGSGLAFVYPGIERLELCRGGRRTKVTAANYDKYIAALTLFTCGEGLERVRERFNDWLFAIFESGLWNAMTAKEKLALLVGEDLKLSLEALKEHIVFAHGYGPSSPQRQMLLEIIAEFDPRFQRAFLKFVTGCELLPVGGLGHLVPRITVAMRAMTDNLPDRSFPSCAVCSHYFKLPAYSSKEIMRAKILEAFLEGEAGFQMS
jgi:E3 ubiquitin-protein ligase TRIP12